jgi:predicted DNA-binding transcriptional regulator YafY
MRVKRKFAEKICPETPQNRPQYHNLRRIMAMVREGMAGERLPNRSDFRRELEVSRRTLARDLDFLRDAERAPIACEPARHGYRHTDATIDPPPLSLSRREVSSFSLARKMLHAFEGTPLEMDMRSTLDKAFALSRFGKVAPTGKRFKRPTRFDWRAFSREPFGIAHGEKPERIRLLFSAHVATFIRERIWHPSQMLRQRRDGSLEMRIETSGHKELVRWVLSWRPDVEVLAPPSLRERVQQKLRTALGATAGR